MNYYVVKLPTEIGICLEPLLTDSKFMEYEKAIRKGFNVKQVDIPEHKIYFKEGKVLDVIEGFQFAPYVNKRTLNILNSIIPESISLAKVGIIEDEEYYLLNVILKLKCMNMSQSEYTLFSNGKISQPSKIVLNKKKLPDDLLLFRMTEYPALLIATDKFVDLVKTQKISGIGFTNIDFLISNPNGDFIAGLPIIE